MSFQSTKIIELGSCAFRQPRAESHCSYLHGYRLTAKFWFEAKELDENHWVVDFGSLKDLKQILQDQFDHTTCIAQDDPLLPAFKELANKEGCDLRIMPSGTGIERIAEWCYNAANRFVAGATNNRCQCTQVEVFEHENNSAIYSTPVDDAPCEEEGEEGTCTVKIDTNKPISIEKDPTITRPPFKEKAKAGAKGKDSKLWPKKTTNTWLNPDSTWGF